LAFEDRDSENGKRMFYDTNWNPLQEYLNTNNPTGFINRPSQLTKMIEYARKLSADFPFVRVDLYNVENKVIFGELTFTPAACLSKAHNEKSDIYFGSLLDLPK